jgi:hypothetical protein
VTELVEIRPGLLRWTAPHPEWEADAEPESPADWPRDVGCVLYEAPSATVLVDPLMPDDLWPTLDERVRPPVRVLTTIRWHGRSRADVLERYDGTEDVPDGVDAIRVLDETMYWLRDVRALVPGDRLIADGDGLRMCPQSWFARSGKTLDDLRTALRPLLDLPVELVLVSHGEPVLERGRDALERAIA